MPGWQHRNQLVLAQRARHDGKASRLDEITQQARREGGAAYATYLESIYTPACVKATPPGGCWARTVYTEAGSTAAEAQEKARQAMERALRPEVFGGFRFNRRIDYRD